MLEVSVNYWSVLAAAIAAMILGLVFYSPKVLGKPWMTLAGVPDKKPKNPGLMMVKGLVIMLVQAFVLALVIGLLGGGVMAGLQAGFWMWLGFVATTTFGTMLWEGKPCKLWLLNNAHNLLSFLLMGYILGVM